jgi:hypothetical protein
MIIIFQIPGIRVHVTFRVYIRFFFWVGWQVGERRLYSKIGYGSYGMFEGSLEVKLPTIWRDEKQSREEA